MTEDENLPEGDNASELHISGDHKIIFIPYKDKKWKFVIKDISFFTQQRIASKLIKQNSDGTMVMNLEQYYRSLLDEVLVNAPPGFDVRKMSPEFGSVFQEHLPSINDFMNVQKIEGDELKN